MGAEGHPEVGGIWVWSGAQERVERMPSILVSGWQQVAGDVCAATWGSCGGGELCSDAPKPLHGMRADQKYGRGENCEAETNANIVIYRRNARKSNYWILSIRPDLTKPQGRCYLASNGSPTDAAADIELTSGTASPERPFPHCRASPAPFPTALGCLLCFGLRCKETGAWVWPS